MAGVGHFPVSFLGGLSDLAHGGGHGAVLVFPVHRDVLERGGFASGGDGDLALLRVQLAVYVGALHQRFSAQGLGVLIRGGGGAFAQREVAVEIAVIHRGADRAGDAVGLLGFLDSHFFLAGEAALWIELLHQALHHAAFGAVRQHGFLGRFQLDLAAVDIGNRLRLRRSTRARNAGLIVGGRAAPRGIVGIDAARGFLGLLRPDRQDRDRKEKDVCPHTKSLGPPGRGFNRAFALPSTREDGSESMVTMERDGFVRL